MIFKQKVRKLLLLLAYSWNFPFAKAFLRKFTRNYDAVRQSLFDKFKINVVFDVGANIGQFAKTLQHSGYKGKIISFEPIDEIRQVITEYIHLFPKWKILPYALGSVNEKSIINISANSASSSLLDMKDTHIEAAPQSKYIKKQEVEVKTLDSIYREYIKEGDRIFLKIDTQGFEFNVLEGSEEFLHKVLGIELEMSFEQLYANETTFEKLYQYLYIRNFRLFYIHPVFQNPETLQLLQADCIFFKV
ncbi:MAG: FkbM family methyltransferase [Chitinophagaceae bacterium]|jgi:FkbM family methyltransferase|nr:FkbM family methyltransferase [Chitinophagaceae bacterium]